VVSVEVAAAICLLAAMALPWFRSTAPRVDLVTLPPGYSGPFDLSWNDWHPSHVDQAVLLTFFAPFVSTAGALARVIFRRRWTKIVLLVGFTAALIGAIEAYGERDIPLTGLATATPAVGLWLFAGAAVAGLLATATDFVVSFGRARS
jgi:hypothetical protein